MSYLTATEIDALQSSNLSKSTPFLIGGVYLAISGIDDDSQERAHCLYLQTEAEIDDFCNICKKVLKDARVGETE